MATTTTIVLTNTKSEPSGTPVSMVLEIEMPNSNLMQKPKAEFLNVLKRAYQDYVETSEHGQRLVQQNNGKPFWAHIVEIPQSFTKMYGFIIKSVRSTTLVLNSDDIEVETTPVHETLFNENYKQLIVENKDEFGRQNNYLITVQLLNTDLTGHSIDSLTRQMHYAADFYLNKTDDGKALKIDNLSWAQAYLIPDRVCERFGFKIIGFETRPSTIDGSTPMTENQSN